MRDTLPTQAVVPVWHLRLTGTVAWSQHPVQGCQELVTPESDGKGRLRLEKIVVPACNRVHRCTGQVRWASAKLESAPHGLKSSLAKAGRGTCRRGWSSCHRALGYTGMHWDVLGCKAVGSLKGCSAITGAGCSVSLTVKSMD